MTHLQRLVAVGTSTGGPKALEQVLTRLPQHFPLPILVVQHMPAGFTRSLAERLNQLSRLQVMEATHGQRVKGGEVYIAPGGVHMLLGYDAANHTYVLELEGGAPISGHRPSVDKLFDSVWQQPLLNAILILLTGMGRDGAEAMLRGKESGRCITLAESARTCVVNGMPGSAVKLGCVDYVVPLHEMADALLRVSGVQMKGDGGR